ncbi:MAG: response regulator [Nitrospirae bacterium]|nr:response regulator [Nitrospirota bacterium]
MKLNDGEKTVLIVDDNETVLLALEFNLQSSGYRVLKASEGKQALQIALSEHPDVIVSDIAMPEMDGIELCRRLRENPEFSEMPFIFLTAHGEPEERVRGLKTGADDYVVKPFDIEELITRIDILYEKVRKRTVSEKLAGMLEEISIPDILQILEQTGKEGIIRVTIGNREGLIRIKQGMVTECRYGDLEGEDAFVEFIRAQRGTFAFQPETVEITDSARPISFMLMEAARLLDEYEAVSSYIPDNDALVSIDTVPETDDPDTERIIRLLDNRALSVDSLYQNAGLSRIRTAIALGSLIRNGVAKTARNGQVSPEKTTVKADERKEGFRVRPFKILFLFCEENSAIETLNQILDTFNEKKLDKIKSGVADFVSAHILGQPVHIFTLLGKQGFEFLYEPLIPSSDAVLYLLTSEVEVKEYRHFRERLETIMRKPCFPITTAVVNLQEEDLYIMNTPDDISSLFLKIFSGIQGGFSSCNKSQLEERNET